MTKIIITYFLTIFISSNLLGGNLKITSQKDLKKYLYKRKEVLDAVSSYAHVQGNLKIKEINCSSKVKIKRETYEGKTYTNKHWNHSWVVKGTKNEIIKIKTRNVEFFGLPSMDHCSTKPIYDSSSDRGLNTIYEIE